MKHKLLSTVALLAGLAMVQSTPGLSTEPGFKGRLSGRAVPG